jgi:nucleoside-diphosphate-sugar epimerase
MRYFLTGATGFIGGTLARQLSKEGHEVRALVRDPGRAEALRSLGVQLHQGDVTDPSSLGGAMDGVDGAFHLAAWYKVGAKDTSEAELINVLGTENVLRAARDARVPKVVYTSTLAVFSNTNGHIPAEDHTFSGEHLSVYDRTKWQAHHEVAEPMARGGLPLVTVLPGAVYGPGDTSPMWDLFARYLRRQLPAVPARTAFCWGHVEDTALAHRLAMEKGRPGESYIIAGPAHSVVEALRMAEAITGIPAPRTELPPWALRAAAALAGFASRWIDLPAGYSAEQLRVSAGTTYLGLAGKALGELGWLARPLEEGLPETLSDFCQRLRIDLPRGGPGSGAAT